MSAIDKIEKIYGKACDEKNLVIANIPFPLVIAWDKTKTTRKIQCHKLVKNDIENIFKDILKEYGLPKIKELGIDIYGGCYNCRLMRGGIDIFYKYGWESLGVEKNYDWMHMQKKI